jgi:hypothetical protein
VQLNAGLKLQAAKADYAMAAPQVQHPAAAQQPIVLDGAQGQESPLVGMIPGEDAGLGVKANATHRRAEHEGAI